MENYTEIKTCRVCGNKKLILILSFGEQHVISFPDKATDTNAFKAPLILVMCSIKDGGCGLLQLKHTFNRELLYRKYWYKSQINTTMVASLKNVVDEAVKTVKLEDGDMVLDIGSNDGTLLKQYASKNIKKVGFEPSDVAEGLEKTDIFTIKDFFNYESFSKRFPGQHAKIITSISMFYDLDDPNQFVDDAKKILAKDGVWIIQMNYLGLMLKNMTFDNILVEHLEYYSLFALENLLKRHDLEIFDISTNDVNGGSIRTYLRHKGSRVTRSEGDKRVAEMRKFESDMKLEDYSTYQKFEKDLQELKNKMVGFVESERAKGKIFYLEGASTRGLVQMEFFGFTDKEFKYALEKDPRKWGKFYASTKIEIIPVEGFYKVENGKLTKDSPSYLYVLPYHFIDNITNDRKDFLKAGGKLIIVTPEFRIIGN